MTEKDISREDLFALIWEKPTVEVARDMGISDVTVAKLCAHLQVPKPPRGYWARVEAGQTPRRPPLRAFRDEIEERRKVIARPRPGVIGLSPIQRKFVDRALVELAAKAVDIGTTRIVSNQIRDMPPEIAAQMLLLIQNRYLVWVKKGQVDVALTHGARQSLAGLVDKLLPVAKPQVLPDSSPAGTDSPSGDDGEGSEARARRNATRHARPCLVRASCLFIRKLYDSAQPDVRVGHRALG